jgi:hypothetical protein
MKNTILLLFLSLSVGSYSQENETESTYKKRVLESTEIDFLSSYYWQEGDNAAVSGGIGTESLTDATAAIIVSIPLNADDVLTIDAGVSAYTSASSSNINPFDGKNPADPFVASSGASRQDIWTNFTGSYSHSSDDRNQILSGKLSISSEYDYFSIGGGASYTRLFNEKNTEISLNGNVYFDTWSLIYPVELRPAGNKEPGEDDEDDHFNINDYLITGNPDYNPQFTPFPSQARNSYSLGLGFSQILSRNVQMSLAADLVMQDGLLSTPFQRVYFSDVADSFIENFHLADDVERLPGSRTKIALGGRLNYYLNQTFVVRTYYRYYFDDWGIQSNTASIEVPIKISQKFTLYPSYRYYNQTQADYFAPYNQHLSTADYYTSDYDLSGYNADQYGFGISYTDIFTKGHLWLFKFKSIDLKYNTYNRSNGFRSNMLLLGVKMIMD